MSDLHGSVNWTELMTRDVEGAKAFYGAVCGWTFESVPMPGFEYVLGKQGDTPVAGIMDMTKSSDDDEADPFWMSYFGVDDVDAAVKAVRAKGGTVQGEPFDVPGVGRIAIVHDPSGAMLGLMTPASQDD